jgi:hypothetical protein
MSNVAKELAAITTEDSFIGYGPALCKKISPPFTTSEDLLSGNAWLCFMMYNHNCEMLIGNTDAEIFVNGGFCRQWTSNTVPA